jgi:hypothetical protein
MKINGEMEAQFHAFMTLIDEGISRFTLLPPMYEHHKFQEIRLLY